MTTRTLIVHTPYGPFCRITSANYVCATVREPVGGAEAYCEAHSHIKRGVHARYIKDRGYVLVWHKSTEAGRREYEKGRVAGYVTSDPLGVYLVEER